MQIWKPTTIINMRIWNEHVKTNLVTMFLFLNWEMLTSVLMALVKNLIKKSFDITFMENEKNCQNIKTFFNWIFNQCPKGIR